MASVHIVDEQRMRDIWLTADADQTIPLEYLRAAFTGAVGLQYTDRSTNRLMLVGIKNDVLKSDWNSKYIYAPVYPNAPDPIDQATNRFGQITDRIDQATDGVTFIRNLVKGFCDMFSKAKKSKSD